MDDSPVTKLQWSGSKNVQLDEPTVQSLGLMSLGVYGGNVNAGARKNEDGALLWADSKQQWEFAVILDGHNSSKSVDMILDAISINQKTIIEALNESLNRAFFNLQQCIVATLFSVNTSIIQGETSCLIFARKGCFLWWFNIGDCLVYLLHPEYAKMGQYAVNQRSFYEWIGEVNTFTKPVPCYSSGIKRLRKGLNSIVAVTDGILECGSRPFQEPEAIYKAIYGSTPTDTKLLKVLQAIHSEQGVDSATIIAWNCFCGEHGPDPSDNNR